MSRWTMADLEQVGLDRLVRPMPRKRVRMPKDVKTAQLAGQKARSKYGAVRTTVDGLTFDSAKEARRYSELRLLEKAGKIFRLQLQPRYRLCAWTPKPVVEVPTIGEYVADFRYCNSANCNCAWGCQIEDTKGVRTALYRWKRKHVEAQYGIRIRET